MALHHFIVTDVRFDLCFHGIGVQGLKFKSKKGTSLQENAPGSSCMLWISF
jgi:hypothetical protein